MPISHIRITRRYGLTRDVRPSGGLVRTRGCSAVFSLAPLAGLRRRGGGTTPSASRRAVTRKPVWPTMRCSGGPPARPRASRGPGLPGGRLVEAALLAERLHGPGQLGHGGDVAAEQPAGDERRGGRVDDSHGASMSSTTRSKLRPGPPICPAGVDFARHSPSPAARPGAGRRRTARRSPGDLGEVGPALVGDQQPARPTARSSQQDSAPEPARPPAPGRRGRCRPSPRSARRPSGRRPPRRGSWTA